VSYLHWSWRKHQILCYGNAFYSTDAPIVAFEPSPKQPLPSYKRQSKLCLNPIKIGLFIFPIALGATKSSDKIISASNDMGNSHIGVGMTDSGTFDSKFNIRVERVESVLKPGYNIALMKLDVSGFECEILKGMGHAFASTVQHIHFDKTDRFLHAHGCTNLLLKLRELGFHIYEGTKEIGPNANLANLGNNLEARRSHPHIWNQFSWRIGILELSYHSRDATILTHSCSNDISSTKLETL